MYASAIGLLAAALGGVTASAASDVVLWEGLRAGMTPEEVMKAAPTSQAIEDPVTIDGQLRLVRIKSLKIAGIEASAFFYFKSKHLSEVDLAAFGDLRPYIEAHYGPGKCRNDREIVRCEWRLQGLEISEQTNNTSGMSHTFFSKADQN